MRKKGNKKYLKLIKKPKTPLKSNNKKSNKNYQKIKKILIISIKFLKKPTTLNFKVSNRDYQKENNFIKQIKMKKGNKIIQLL